MLTEIYKILRLKKFSSKGEDEINNKRLGIKKSFRNDKYYIEIWNETYGFSLVIYGGGFMNGYWPTQIDILDKSDLNFLTKKLDLEFKNAL